MDCTEFMKQMSSYLNGELEEPLQAETDIILIGFAREISYINRSYTAPWQSRLLRLRVQQLGPPH